MDQNSVTGIGAPVQQEILFLDDFSHQNSNCVHWDHIKFNHPVYLEQIRIIPRNCSISLRDGAVKYGLTNPNKFKLEFYANNLNKSDEERASLDKIGSILYDDDYTQDENNSAYQRQNQSSGLLNNSEFNNYLLKPSSIPLDWLVIVGSYLSLSIALIGVKAKPSNTLSISPNSIDETIPYGILTSTTVKTLLPTPISTIASPNLNLDQVNIHRQSLLPSPSPFQTLMPSNPTGYPMLRPKEPQIRYALINSPVNNHSKTPNSINMPPPMHTPHQRPQMHRQVNNYPRPYLNRNNSFNSSLNNSAVNSVPLLSTPPMTKIEQFPKQLSQKSDESESIEDKKSELTESIVEVLENPNLKLKLSKFYAQIDDDIQQYNPTIDKVEHIESTELNDLNNFRLNETLKIKPIMEITSKSHIKPKSIDELINIPRSELEQLLSSESSQIFNSIISKLSHVIENSRSANKIEQISETSMKKRIKLDVLSNLNNTFRLILNITNLELNSDISNQFIDTDIQSKLLDLIEYEQEQFQNETLRFKLISCLCGTLNSFYGIEYFLNKFIYSRLCRYFLALRASLRSALLLSSILSKCTFFTICNRFTLKFKTDNLDNLFKHPETITELLGLFKSIYVYCYRSLLNRNVETNEQTIYPVKGLFIHENRPIVDNYKNLIHLIDKFNLLKYVIILWSHVRDELDEHDQQTHPNELKCLNILINKFINEIILMNRLNSFNDNGVKYLRSSSGSRKLANIFLELLSEDSNDENETYLNLSSQLFIDDLFETKLIPALNCLDELTLAESIDTIQSFSLQVKEAQHKYLLNMLSMNNFSNKYSKCLLDFFEYALQMDEPETNDNQESSILKCYLINTLVDLFAFMVKHTDKWFSDSNQNQIDQVTRLGDFMKKIKLHMTTIPAKLNDKITCINMCIEPVLLYSSCTDISNKSSFLSSLIDKLRLTINKNLFSLFKSFKTSSTQSTHKLVTNVNQLLIIRNLISTDNIDNGAFTRKLLIGYLLSRNFLHILLNIVEKLNDYFLFYLITQTVSVNTVISSSTSFRDLINLITNLIRIIIKNSSISTIEDSISMELGENISKSKSSSTYLKLSESNLFILFKFYSLVNYSSDSTGNVIFINENLNDTFKILFENDAKNNEFLCKLADFTLQSPFYFEYGLSIMNKLVNERNNHNNLNDSVKTLFRSIDDTGDFIREKGDIEEFDKSESEFVRMVKVFSLSSNSTLVNRLFKNLCINMCNLSDRSCKSVVKALVMYLLSIMNKFNSMNTEKNEIKDQMATDIVNPANMLSFPNEQNELETEIDTENQNETSLAMETASAPVSPNNMPPPAALPAQISPVQSDIESISNEQADNYNLIMSQLIKFICDLISQNEKFRFKLYEFISMPISSIIKSKNQISETTISVLLKYINVKSDSKSVILSKEAIFILIESLIRNSSEKILTDENNLNHSQLVMILLEFICNNPSPNNQSLVLYERAFNCLIFIFNNFKSLGDNPDDNENLFNMFVGQNLKSNASLVNFVNELVKFVDDQDSKDISSYITGTLDILIKFFIYVNQITIYLHSRNQIEKLKELFKWSNTNTNELLLDSIISTSAANPFLLNNNQHKLVVLDKQIGTLFDFSNQPQQAHHAKKSKCCLSNSKRLLKLLNDLEVPNQSNLNIVTQAEFDMAFSLYFNDSNTVSTSSDKELEINVEEYVDKVLQLSGKFDPKSIIMMDKDLLRQLSNDDLYLSTEKDTSQDTDAGLNGSNDGESLISNNNNNVINTRTGFRYKAPMRGGHNNVTSSRNQPTNTNLTLNNNISSNPLNNSNLLNGNNSNGSVLQVQPPQVNGMHTSNSSPSLVSPSSSISTNSPTINNNIRHDPFRTRPPNTSRPPSVHVDDFYRMASAQKQQQQHLQHIESNIVNNNNQNNINNNNNNLVVINNENSMNMMNNHISPANQLNKMHQIIQSSTASMQPPPVPLLPTQTHPNLIINNNIMDGSEAMNDIDMNRNRFTSPNLNNTAPNCINPNNNSNLNNSSINNINSINNNNRNLMTNSNNDKQLNNEFMMPMLPQSYPSTIQNPNINNVGSINPNLNNLNQTQTHQLNDQLNRIQHQSPFMSQEISIMLSNNQQVMSHQQMSPSSNPGLTSQFMPIPTMQQPMQQPMIQFDQNLRFQTQMNPGGPYRGMNRRIPNTNISNNPNNSNNSYLRPPN